MSNPTPDPLEVVEMTHPDLDGTYRKPRAYLVRHPDWSEVGAEKPRRPARKAAEAAEKEHKS